MELAVIVFAYFVHYNEFNLLQLRFRFVIPGFGCSIYLVFSFGEKLKNRMVVS
jgi:hypothetical protein